MISKAFRQAYAHYYMLCIVYAQWHDQGDFKIERTCSRLQWRSKAWKEKFPFPSAYPIYTPDGCIYALHQIVKTNT